MYERMMYQNIVMHCFTFLSVTEDEEMLME
jgi:hypothetical protein